MSRRNTRGSGIIRRTRQIENRCLASAGKKQPYEKPITVRITIKGTKPQNKR